MLIDPLLRCSVDHQPGRRCAPECRVRNANCEYDDRRPPPRHAAAQACLGHRSIMTVTIKDLAVALSLPIDRFLEDPTQWTRVAFAVVVDRLEGQYAGAAVPGTTVHQQQRRQEQ